MALIGNTYVQDTDPGAVGYGYFWQKMNGDRSARNTSNTAWVAQGNVNQAYSGAAPLSGFTAQGPITGATGLAMLQAANFQSLMMNSVNVATVNDLSDAETAILKSCDAKINSSISGITASSAYSTMFAYGTGTALAHGQTIPLPSFSDRTATPTEVVMMLVAPCVIDSVFTGNYTWKLRCNADPSTRVVYCSIYNSNNNEYFGTVNYIIMAQRKN